jgi:hypothetical protein
MTLIVCSFIFIFLLNHVEGHNTSHYIKTYFICLQFKLKIQAECS